MSVELPPSAAPRSALPAENLPEAVRARLLELVAVRTEPVATYLYDGEVAAARARQLRAALPEWAEVYYAVKANSYPGVLSALAPHVDGFEVASTSELALVAPHVPARRGIRGQPVPIVAAGPAKSVPLLSELVRVQVASINVESPLELHRVSRLAVEQGTVARVALRVNPDGIAVTGSLRMGGEPSQFGVAEPDLPEVLALAARLPGLELLGFHIHAASNNLDAASYADYVRWCVRWAVRTARKYDVQLRQIDVGGGIGVNFEGEEPFDTALFGEAVAAAEPPEGARVILEPGRFLVADCGWYAAEVTDVKSSYGQSYAMLRGGINHFQLPTSWDIVHNAAVLPVDRWEEGCPRPEATHTPVTVVGELCTPEDTLLREVRMTRVRAGDLVVFPYAGSYGWEFAMPHFLGHPPAERMML